MISIFDYSIENKLFWSIKAQIIYVPPHLSGKVLKKAVLKKAVCVMLVVVIVTVAVVSFLFAQFDYSECEDGTTGVINTNSWTCY